MCLAIPMKVVEIVDKNTAIAETDGVRTRVSITLITEAKLGDFVIIHAGYAIEKVDQQEADLRIQLFKELSEINRLQIKTSL